MTLPRDVSLTYLTRQTQLILASYERWFKKPLWTAADTPEKTALEIFDAPFVLLSSNTDKDPVLNYGNRKVLELWEMNWETLCKTPGRKTAEPMERSKRERFLAAVRQKGFVTDYHGVRISSTGKRFEIKRALVWNLLGPSGEYLGQAASFSDWICLQD